MPTYRVDRAGSDLPRVVVASLPSSALKHVVQDEITVRQIEVDEAFELAQQGVQLERAGETPAERGIAEPPQQPQEPGLTANAAGGGARLEDSDAPLGDLSDEDDDESEFAEVDDGTALGDSQNQQFHGEGQG